MLVSYFHSVYSLSDQVRRLAVHGGLSRFLRCRGDIRRGNARLAVEKCLSPDGPSNSDLPQGSIRASTAREAKGTGPCFRSGGSCDDGALRPRNGPVPGWPVNGYFASRQKGRSLICNAGRKESPYEGATDLRAIAGSNDVFGQRGLGFSTVPTAGEGVRSVQGKHASEPSGAMGARPGRGDMEGASLLVRWAEADRQGARMRWSTDCGFCQCIECGAWDV